MEDSRAADPGDITVARANNADPRHVIVARRLPERMLVVRTAGRPSTWTGPLDALARNARFIRGLGPLDAFALGLWFGGRGDA